MAISKSSTHSWPNLIAQWRLSGLTQAAFCARRGISLPTFRYHLYKPRCRSGTPRPLVATHTADAPLFLPSSAPLHLNPVWPSPPPPPSRSSSAMDSASPSPQDSIPRPSDASSMP